MRPTPDNNPSGITEYDLTEFALLPEWHHLSKALNNVIYAATRRGMTGQQKWLDALHHHATALPFADCCSTCARQDGLLGEPVVPAVTHIKGDRLTGTYVCPQGHRWTCHYSVPLIGDLP